MANSDIIKIGFDYRASLAQFEKDTNGVFDGISNKAGKQKIAIQLDAKDEKVIDKIKELQKLKLDKFTFEFGESGLKEQLQTFDKLENKINEIINLGKGKSFIDSSSTVAGIDKIENKINELNKKYEETQKKLSSIGSGNISGKDVNLVDNAEFKKLSDSFEKIKGEVDDLKTHMSLLDDSVVSGEQFIKLGEQVDGLSVKFDGLIDKYVKLSNTQKTLFSTPQESNISLGNSAEQYKQITADTVSVLSDVGKTEDQIISKIQQERKEAEKNNEVLREHLVLLDSAGKVVANHLGSTSNVNGTFSNEQLSQANGGKIIHTHPGKASFFGGKDLQNLFQNSMYDQIKQIELVWGDSSLSIDKSTLTKESSSTILNIMRNVRKTLTEVYGNNEGGMPSQEAREHINAIEKEIFKTISQKLNVSVSENGSMANEVTESLSDIDKAIIKRFQGIKSSVVQDIDASDIIKSQMKDAFPKTSENLEQVAQSEQKVQQEAVATDKALDNINFTPNTEGFDDIITKFGILREQAEQITKIVKTTKQNADGADISYKATLKNGNSYYLGENSTPQVLNASETVYDAKADNVKKLEREKQIWNELTTSLDRYATLQKRIASNNALSTDTEEATRLLDYIHDLQRSDVLPTEKLNASNEKLQQINQTVTDLKAKLKESTLDSLQGSIDKYQKIYDQRSTYSSDFTPSEQYTKNLTGLETAIKNLVEYRNTLKNVGEVTVEQETYLKGLVAACEKASDSFKSLSASEKGTSQIAVDKLVQRINKDLDECTNYSKEAKLGLRALRDELESANPRNLKEITSEIINIENAEIRAGRAGRSFFDTLKNSGFHQIAAQMAGMFGVYDVINVIKQAASTVTELNTQITELAKVSEQSSKQIYADFDSYADIAKEVRGTISDTIAATADWSKNGYSIPDSKQLAEISQLYKNVGDGIDIDAANESLISTLKGFQLEADQAEHIVDVFNEVSNNEAISSGGIGEALQRSAASFNAANTELEKSVALVTATRLHRLVEYMETYIENIFNCHRSLYYYVPQYRG